jgi:hypothetical protein
MEEPAPFLTVGTSFAEKELCSLGGVVLTGWFPWEDMAPEDGSTPFSEIYLRSTE